MEDNEKTFAELYERIEKTVAVLKGAKEETFVDVVCPASADVLLSQMPMLT